MSVGGVAFAVLLILIVVSLYRGWSGAGSIYTKLPGEVWVAQTGTIDPFHSTSLLPAGRESALRRVPGVVSALPVYARHLAFPIGGGNRVDAYAMAIAAPRFRMASDLKRFFPAPGHIVIERSLADAAGVAPGGTLHILGRTLVVDRLLSGGNKIVQFAFLNPLDAKALLGEPGQRQLLPARDEARGGPRRRRKGSRLRSSRAPKPTRASSSRERSAGS